MGSTSKTTPPRTFRDDVDELRRLVRRSVAFWRRTLVVLAAAAIVTGIVLLNSPPIYRSETLILYQETIRSSDLTGGEGGGDNARRIGARLRDALLSRATLEPIVTELHLFAKSGADRHDLVDAVEEMRKRITFKAREGDTFSIAFDGTTPEQTQEVTRRLGERIVQYAATRRSAHARTLKEFLDGESERNQASLKVREAALAQFLSAHPEFDLPTTQGDMHVPLKTTVLQTPRDPDLVVLEIRADRIEQQLKAMSAPALRSPAPVASAPAPVPDSPEVISARKDLADKLLRFTDKHPDVVDARLRLEAAEAAQARARAAAAAAAEAAASSAAPIAPEPVDEHEREVLTQRLASLRAQIAAMRAAGATSGQAAKPDVEDGNSVSAVVEFRRLVREVNDARDRQRQLDDRQFKASIVASMVADDRNIQVSVLDPAYLPTHPVSKSRSFIMVGGLVLGVVLAFVTALVSARLDDRLYERVDVAMLDVVEVLAVIPPPTEGAARLEGSAGHGAMGGAYD